MLLRDFVNKKIASADKEASAEGVPLVLNNCKKYKKMRDLKVYGNCFQDGTPTPENPIEVQCVGELVTDESDINYGKYRVPIVQRGKNLCTPYLPITVTNCTYENGVVTQKTADTSTSPYFKIVAYYTDGSVSTLSTTHNVDLGKRAIKFTLPEKDVKHLSFNLNGSKIDTAIRIQKIPAGTYVISFNVLNNVQGSFSWCDMQIEEYEEGVTPTDYEPYVEPIKTNLFLNEPLRDCSGWGYVIGSVHSVDCIDARNKKLYRFNHEYYLDGNQTITKWSDSVYLIQMGAPRCMNIGGAAVSNHFRHGVHNASIASIQMSNAIGTQIQISNPTLIDGVTDAESLKQWFAENPTTFIQPLETPIVEDLNIELPKLNAKTTIIEVDTSLAPSNISGKYIIR